MSIATKTTRPVEIESNHTATAVRHRDWHWAVCALAAAVTLGVASFLPLWTMTLHAPQYPAGLQLKAYGTRMEGDLSEINELNHYIGIKAIEPDASGGGSRDSKESSRRFDRQRGCSKGCHHVRQTSIDSRAFTTLKRM